MQRDDGWARGFAEPDLGYEDPPAATSSPEPGKAGLAGADERGVITVQLDGSGAVAGVVVPRDWRDTIGPHELGQALLTAANSALSAWLVDMVDRSDLEPKAPRTSRTDALDAGGDPSSEVAQNLVAESVELFAQFDRDFAMYREQLAKAASRTAEARGSNGRIQVTMEPGSVSRVTVDPRWASYARHTEIGAEALGAFRAAGRQLAGADPSTVPLPASLARIRELAGDTAALCTELGLPGQRR